MKAFTTPWKVVYFCFLSLCLDIMERKNSNDLLIRNGQKIDSDISDNFLRMSSFLESNNCPKCREGKMGTATQLPFLPPTRATTFVTSPLNHPRHMSSYAGRTRTSLEDGEFNINPEPVPYQPQNFMSSTLLKKVPIPKRHLDSFGGYEYTLGSKRGVILHTDRYQWDAVKSLEGMSQRDRLKAELEYMERLRGIKRRREMLPHRAQLDLLMGGKKVEFSERFDIQREIQKLKSLIMPQNARDLFHGRGFQLPDQHSSLKPRKPPSLDYDSDEDVSVSANLQRFPRTVVDPDTGLSKARPFHQQSHLPRINNKNPLGMTSAYLKRSRTNIQNKFEATMNRAQTQPDAEREKNLKLTTQSDTVKRVEIPSAAQLPRSRGIPRTGLEPPPSPDPTPLRMGADIAADLPTVEGISADKEGRPDSPKSRQSQRTRNSVSPIKAATPNPLKGSELPETLPENQRNELKEAFKKLDTDSDGHLMYNQLKTQLPKKLSTQQERFLKEVYDITSSNTFFGVEEFMTMSSLTTVVENLKDEAVAAYNSLDFSKLHENIVHYVDLFQSVDRGQRGKISLEALQELLTTELQKDLEENQNLWGAILEVVEPNEAIKVSKVEYLAHIPYFLALKKT